MYLSKLHLDIHSMKARKCMRDCQEMHRSVQRLFQCSRQDSGALYRFNPQRMDVYVLSAAEPEASVDMSLAGMSLVGVKNLLAMEQNFSAGQCYRFDLLAMPSKKQPREGHKNSQRRFLRTPEERMQWLQRKSIQYGFALLQVQEEEQVAVDGYHDSEHGGRMKGQAVRFQGVLVVKDTALFCQGWKGGIGAGKAYGLGMLLLGAFG